MKLLLMVTVYLTCSVYAVDIDGFDISENELKESVQELQKWRNFAEEVKAKPDAELISKLGLGLRKTTMTSIYIAGDREGTRKAIQESLLAIPGHSLYYSNRINNARGEVDEILKKGKYPPFNYLLDEQKYGFQTLAQLPSPETVRVLGDFLSDDRGRFNPSPELSEEEIIDRRTNWGQKPNSLLAARALNDLSLKSRPYPKKRFTHDDDIRPWQLWYEQVKAGRRTFSFEGDPQEYDLTGPVREARNPDLIRAAKRSGASGDSSVVAEKPAASSSAAVWMIGAFVGLTGVGGYIYARRTKLG